MKRHYPIGAEIFEQGVHFRVWAPACKKVRVILEQNNTAGFALTAENNGYFSGLMSAAKENVLYKFQLDLRSILPDPAARFQPYGPHGPSQVINPHGYQWHDKKWRGIEQKKAVIYEMHMGTFTKEGTWRSAMAQLPELARLGITVIELMPIAEFAGSFGWGYDGVDLFAPYHHYGQPDDLRRFIDTAHQLNIGVILDVVYNHLGPDGNYLKDFCPNFFAIENPTEWGEAINFSHNAKSVREFFITNARYWVEEFHFDGLRIDATQNIYDHSSPHILAEINSTLRQAIKNRTLLIIGENEPQQSQLLRAVNEGGYGFNALWNDDFHHSAVVRMTGRKEAYFTDYKGTAQEFISAIKYNFLFQGQWFSWQNQPRGSPALKLAHYHFIHFLQNHDQVGNTAYGLRMHQLASSGIVRAMTALLLLAPQIPMIFQGQEFAASTPFNYFADHIQPLANAVRKGRFDFLKQFKSLNNPAVMNTLPDPSDPKTFLASKLDFSERAKHAMHYRLYEDLLNLRKRDPIFSGEIESQIDGAVLNQSAFLIRFFAVGADRLLIINLGINFWLKPAPEPLLAPPLGHDWDLLWSSSAPEYGGTGVITWNNQENWHLNEQSLIVLIPRSKK